MTSLQLCAFFYSDLGEGTKHAGYVDEYAEVQAAVDRTMEMFGFVDEVTLNIYLWMRWTIQRNDAPTAGHTGREKTYLLLTRDLYWNHQYKWVRKLRFNHFRHRRSVGSPSLWTLSLVF
ncbi:hypothetical protein JG688_00018624, partial [Phytophthora aleatoria]